MIPQESDFDPSSHQRHDSNYIFAACSTTLFSRAESATWSHALSEGGPLSSRYGLLIQKNIQDSPCLCTTNDLNVKEFSRQTTPDPRRSYRSFRMHRLLHLINCSREDRLSQCIAYVGCSEVLEWYHFPLPVSLMDAQH